MDIINRTADNYQRELSQKQDPLAQLAGSVGLRVNSPEAEQKLRVMAQAVSQQAAQGAQIKQADAVDKATTNWKQGFFEGKV
jgi:DUF971 family protein